MLQLTLGLPFLQWSGPSTLSLTVVNAAPFTGVFAPAGDAMTTAPNSTMHVETTVMAASARFIFLSPFVFIRPCRNRLPAGRLLAGWPFASNHGRLRIPPFPRGSGNPAPGEDAPSKGG